MNDGYVYFVYSPATNLVKIGYTARPEHRFKGIQTGNGDLLRPLYFHATERAPRLEGELHARCKSYRQQGEWFTLTKEVLGVIENLKGSPVNPSVACPFPPPIPIEDSRSDSLLSRMYREGYHSALRTIPQVEIPQVEIYTWQDILDGVACEVESHCLFPLDQLDYIHFAIDHRLGGGTFLIPKGIYKRELGRLHMAYPSISQPSYHRQGCQDTAYLLFQAKTLEEQLEVLLGALAHDAQSSRTGFWNSSGRKGRQQIIGVAREARQTGLLDTHGGWHRAATGATLDFEMEDSDSALDARKCVRLIYRFATYLAFNFVGVVATTKYADPETVRQVLGILNQRKRVLVEHHTGTDVEVPTPG